MATKTATQNTAKTSATKHLAMGKRSLTARSIKKPASSVFERVLRENLHWLFLSAAAIIAGILLFVGYQKVVASSIFAVKRIDVSGAKRTDSQKIEEIVRNLTVKNGIWNADLALIQKEIARQSWVKSASVTRVLPDGLRIRLSERLPVAVVRLDSGAKFWVDEEARLLGEVALNENAPFVITGWNEANDAADEEATKKNRNRVQLYLRLLSEFRQAEISDRIAAVDLSVLQDVETTVEQNGSVKQIKLGNRDFTERLKPALTLLETLESNGELERVDRIIAYDRTPIVRYKMSVAQTSIRDKQKR